MRNVLQHRDAVLVGESGLTVAARHLQTPRNGERKRREEWPNSPRSRAVLASYMLQKQEQNRIERRSLPLYELQGVACRDVGERTETGDWIRRCCTLGWRASFILGQRKQEEGRR